MDQTVELCRWKDKVCEMGKVERFLKLKITEIEKYVKVKEAEIKKHQRLINSYEKEIEKHKDCNCSKKTNEVKAHIL